MLSYALHSVVGEKDEDRMSVCLSHGTEGMPRLASFLVCDGHAGVGAARFCQEHFASRVARRIKALLDSAEVSDGMASQMRSTDEVDHIICESLRRTCLEMDLNTKMRDASGTTLNGVLILRDEMASRTRVYCVNVGDSRCVLFAYPRDSHSNPASTRTFESASSSWNVDDHPSLKSHSIFPMSEDHKVTHPSERLRLLSDSRQSVEWSPFPRIVYSTDTSIIAPRGSAAISDIYVSLPPMDPVCEPQVIDNGDALEDLDFLKHRIRRENSFLGNRATPEGDGNGPEAIFGRFNVSINMTRTIGDKYGPRCCIAVPEVTLAVVSFRDRVRLVIASDGVWDVLSEKNIQPVVLSDSDLSDAAEQICTAARDTRQTLGLRMDDISAIVVEISPEAEPSTLQRCRCTLS